MDRFDELLKAIKAYDNEAGGMKATSHHSAVSVRVAEMKAAMALPKQSSKDKVIVNQSKTRQRKK